MAVTTSFDYTPFKERLEQERERLQAELEVLIAESLPSGTASVERTGYSNHMAEDATEIFEQERNMALKRNLEDLLKATEIALAKIASGTYGLCEECGQPIDLARLEVKPAANYCIPCKSKRERR